MASLRTGTDKADDQSCIINNFRPPLPLGDRSVSLYTGEAAHSSNSNDDAAEIKKEGNNINS